MLSVFTPSHDPRYLDECWQSLRAQTHRDFEWIVVLNGKATKWKHADDPRIRLLIAPEVRGVGALKAYACRAADGDILVELDHDDVLASDALGIIDDTFTAYPAVGFVYSDGAQILEDGTMDTTTWDTNNGWQYRPETVDGRKVLMVEAMEPTPHNVSYIWFAPNHVRAFRKSAYHLAGGYDITLDVLDDQDLMCRLYATTQFKRIPECLYLQRVHATNTQREQSTNALIQTRTVELYDRYVQANALAWSRWNGLKALDLGGRTGKPDGFLAVDKHDGPEVDIVGDVFSALRHMKDSTVGVIRAVDFLEHVVDKVRLINECHRVLAPDGMLLTSTPSSDGRGAFQDPTHVSYWNENSWWYYTDQAYAQYVPDITARFQTSRAVSFFPSDFHREHDIPYVTANLIALKPGGHRNGGYLRWQ